jgi:hypothetical protein
MPSANTTSSEQIDRGPYRSCYIAMADDADIHAMSGDAFKLLWMLKLTLPTAGIGVVYDSMLADRVGVPRERLNQLFAELEAPKPESDRGWIVRDRNVVWLVHALECEPGMKEHSPNHRKNVLGSVNQLPPRSPVVAAFKQYYAKWFPDVAEGDGEAFGKGSERVTDPEAVAVAVQKQFKDDAVDLEHPPAAGASTPPAAVTPGATATASPSAEPKEPQLPPNARRLLRDKYDIRGRIDPARLSKRQQQILRDLLATLGPRGALFIPAAGAAREYVRAVDAEHLDHACTKILAMTLKKADAAFPLVLLELRKTWQEVTAARDKAAIGESSSRSATPGGRSAPTSVRALLFAPSKDPCADDAQNWLDNLGEPDAARISTELERLVSAKCPPNRAPSVRAHLRTEILVQIWKRENPTPAGVG